MPPYENAHHATDPLTSAARRTPMLDAISERSLLLAARAGNVRATERIVLAHLRTVLALVPSFRRTGVTRDDLVSEGVLGLLEAISRFDCDRDNRFATYARFWVRARLRRYVDETRHVVSPPSTRAARRVRQRYTRTVESATHRLGRPPTREEIATALDTTSEEVAAVEPTFGAYAASITERPDGSVIELRADEPSPEEMLAEAEHQAQIKARIEDGLSVLDARERATVLRRLASDEPESFADLGRDFAVSRERVRQISERACEKLRKRVA